MKREFTIRICEQDYITSCNYKDNVLHGFYYLAIKDWRGYLVYEKGRFQNGMKDGNFSSFYTTGTHWENYLMKDNRLAGDYILWFPSQMINTYIIWDGKSQHVQVKMWDENTRKIKSDKHYRILTRRPLYPDRNKKGIDIILWPGEYEEIEN